MSDSLVRDASRLIYFGLDQSLRPSRLDEYARLVERYYEEPELAEHASTIAIGMELTLVHVGRDTGAILTCTERNTAFAMKLTDYRSTLDAEDKDAPRSILALVQIGVALTFFPSAADLEDTERPSRPDAMPRDVVETIWGLCERLEEEHRRDAGEIPRILRLVWEDVLAMPASRPKAKRRSFGSLQGVVLTVMHQLETQGLISLLTGEGPTASYAATLRYQLMLQSISSQAFEICQRLTEEAAEEA